MSRLFDVKSQFAQLNDRYFALTGDTVPVLGHKGAIKTWEEAIAAAQECLTLAEGAAQAPTEDQCIVLAPPPPAPVDEDEGRGECVTSALHTLEAAVTRCRQCGDKQAVDNLFTAARAANAVAPGYPQVVAAFRLAAARDETLQRHAREQRLTRRLPMRVTLGDLVAREVRS